jgi:parvulin-like peptidyl-prolyl isomerase
LKSVIFQLELKNIMEFEAEERGIEEDEDYIRRLTNFREGVMVDKFQRSVLGKEITVTEEEIHEYYAAHVEDFELPRRFRVREIEVPTLEETEEILEKLNAGEDFAALASQYSIRPGQAETGGDLGYLTGSRYPPLYEAAQQLKQGEVSKAIENSRGYYSIIKLLETRDATMRKVEDCALEIKQEILRQKRNDLSAQWIAEERARRDIRIFEDVIEASIDKSKYEQG